MSPRVMLVLDLPRIAWAEAAVGHANVVVQVRDRAAHARDIVLAARALVERGVCTVVNDRIDLALAAGAAGVHLPEEGVLVEEARALLGPDALVGVSTHVGTRFEERARGASWAVFGPIWATPAKGPGVGVEALAEAVRRCPCPVFAVGGVDATRVPEALGAGAAGVAVIRAAQDLPGILEALG